MNIASGFTGFATKKTDGETAGEPAESGFSRPVLARDDEHWAARPAIDAVVADACGLFDDQYAHILSTFKHTSYPKAPELCLARFDELKSIGLGSLAKKPGTRISLRRRSCRSSA